MTLADRRLDPTSVPAFGEPGWVPDPLGDGHIARGTDPTRLRAAADHMPRLPISVLDARTGWWADRKRRWRDLIGDGAETRTEVRTGGGVQTSAPMTAGRTVAPAGGSTFDPVLAELIIRWWGVPGGAVLDPFAGGATRGLVAAHFGQRYHGIDIRPAQVEANRAVAAARSPSGLPAPQWATGDATAPPTGTPTEVDLLVSCPPYADLERYSDDPRDLSTMTYPAFRDAHREAIGQACDRLADDRYAVWVVGEARGRDGLLHGIVPDTIATFRAAGLGYLSEAVLVTPAGNLPIRAPGQFFRTRALARAHQTVLVFVKGDRRRAMRATRDRPVSEQTGDRA